MSDIDTPMPSRPTRLVTSKLDGFVRLARPIGFYVCLFVVALNGILPPIASLFGHHVVAVDWAGMAVMCGPIVAWILARSWDKTQGTQL